MLCIEAGLTCGPTPSSKLAHPPSCSGQEILGGNCGTGALNPLRPGSHGALASCH